jgi:uncharacterized membrane protein
MLALVQRLWRLLRGSLWFLPGIMVLGACGLAYGLIEFDRSTSFDGGKRFPLLFGVGAQGSRSMLTAIAGSMLTVAALVFSLTLSTISQVSSQYSPRVLRNFMRDRGNQVVMGYFVAVFAYCLLVLGTIRGTDEQKFVPSTAILAGLTLALGGVAALIYFIHHIAESLQTDTILQRISKQSCGALDELFPAKVGEPAATPATASAWQAALAQPGWQAVAATATGYVQRIDGPALLDWAAAHGAWLRVEQPVGAFVGAGDLLLSYWPHGAAGTAPDQAAHRALAAAVQVESHRSIEQDVAFGVQQLVDIALKALSPGINDTTTAIMAVDHLGLLCARLAARPFPPALRTAPQPSQMLVWAPARDFAGYLRLAFDLVRINSKGNHALFRRLLRKLALVAESANTEERKAVVRTQAQLLLQCADDTLATDYEKQSVRAVYRELQPAWAAE